MGFFLDKKYISDSYLRENLLSNEKKVEGSDPKENPQGLSDEDLVILRKLNVEVIQTTTDDLIDHLLNYLSKNNIDKLIELLS